MTRSERLIMPLNQQHERTPDVHKEVYEGLYRTSAVNLKKKSSEAFK